LVWPSRREGQLSSALAIEGVRLACVRGDRLLFRDLNFRVAAGDVLAIEGPNGAGKTSLLRIVAGFVAPAEGSVAVLIGGDRIDDAEERGKHVGWLGHNDAAKSQLTPAELLHAHAGLYGASVGVGPVLDRVGLSSLSELPCQYLSAGQKKRLALARLMLCRRAVWLLDEPLASLDEAGKRLVAEVIADYGASGGIVMAATHESLGIECGRMRLGA
jgi:heme exporter protein A